MKHPRARIRESIFGRLKSKKEDGKFPTSAEGRVFKSRIVPVDTNDDEELPCIMVYARDENRDPARDYGPDADDSWTTAHLVIVVEALCRGGITVDDKLDDMAAEIEALLEDWEIPGFEGATMRLGDSDIDVIADKGIKPVGAIGLVWHVSYTRPWRARPAGTRPHTVDVRIGDDAPDRIITNDRGIYNQPGSRKPSGSADIDAFLAGAPVYTPRGRK